MERSTFSVAFYVRKTRTNKHGEAAIVVRITVDGTRADLAAQKMVNPKLWDTARGKAYERTPLTRELNMYLDSVRAKLIRIHRDMEQDDAQNVTVQAIVNRYLGKDKPERHTLMELFREHNEKCRALSGIDMAPATILRYETSLRHTEQLMQHTYRKQDMYLDELNRQFIMDYEFYLKSVRRCNHHSATKYLKNFKKIVRLALDKEWLEKDPFAGVKFKFEQVDRDFLEMHEVEKLLQKQIDIPRMAQVWDVFVFCCFTGLAYADVKKLTHNDIHTDERGDMWIIDKRQKTGTQFRIKLLPVAKELATRYRRLMLPGDKAFPVKDRDSMNMSLRQVARHAGLSFSPTIHEARHTFSTTVTLSQGVPLETVSKMLGHKHITTTQIYAKITNDKIGRDMDALSEKIADKFRMAQ